MSTENDTKTAAKSFAEMQSEIREVNVANGWYDGPVRFFGDDVSLLHSEVSEMYEAFRQWGMDDATGGTGGPHAEHCDTTDISLYTPAGTPPPCTCGFIPKPEGVGSEAADVLIRLLDTCDRHGIDLTAEYERKLAHNRTRGYRHGGKRV